MPVALILSSHVAGSGVGGGLQVAELSRLGFRTALVPTVLFGRHPGLGPPGGGAVSDAVFAGQVECMVLTYVSLSVSCARRTIPTMQRTSMDTSQSVG